MREKMKENERKNTVNNERNILTKCQKRLKEI